MRTYQFWALFAVGCTLAFVPAAVRYAIGATAAKITYKTGEKAVTTGSNIVHAVVDHVKENSVSPSQFTDAQAQPQTITVRVVQGGTAVVVDTK